MHHQQLRIIKNDSSHASLLNIIISVISIAINISLSPWSNGNIRIKPPVNTLIATITIRVETQRRVIRVLAPGLGVLHQRREEWLVGGVWLGFGF